MIPFSPLALAIGRPRQGPAALLGRLLGHFSGGGLVLQQAEGSLWQVAASWPAVTPAAQPHPVAAPGLARFRHRRAARLAMGWVVQQQRQPLAHVEPAPADGPQSRPGPPRPRRRPRRRCPHAAARAGWQGDLSLGKLPAGNARRRPLQRQRPACCGAAPVAPSSGPGLRRTTMQSPPQTPAPCASTCRPSPARIAPAAGQKRPIAACPLDGQLSGRPGLLRRLRHRRRRCAKPGAQPGPVRDPLAAAVNPVTFIPCIFSQNVRLTRSTHRQADP